MAHTSRRQPMLSRIRSFGALLAFLCSMALYSFAEEKLYVFYPTTARPQTVQETLKESFSGVEVTVFGRYNDFNEKVATDPPDAVIAKPALIEQLGGFSIVLSGMRNGKSEDTYVLMSLKNPIDPKDVSSETVLGAIDVLGKAGMESFIKKLFQAGPKLKRVTKVEDLLPLLSFNMASGVIVEDVFVNYFRATSQLELGITPLPAVKSGIIGLALKNGAKAEKTVNSLKKGDKKISTLFEVDAWK